MFTVLQRMHAKGKDPLVVALIPFASTTFIGTAVAMFSSVSWRNVNVMDSFKLIGSGVGFTLFYLMTIIATQHEKPLIIQVLSYSNIVYALLFDVVFFADSPDVFDFLGILLIFLSGILSLLK
jgi:drug/metabolite transporter (DMT)-like permease